MHSIVQWSELFARRCAIANLKFSYIDPPESALLQMICQQTQPCNIVAVCSIMTPNTVVINI